MPVSILWYAGEGGFTFPVRILLYAGEDWFTMPVSIPWYSGGEVVPNANGMLLGWSFTYVYVKYMPCNNAGVW